MPAVTSLKVCTLMYKAYKVLDKKVQNIMSHGTEEWSKEELILVQ